MRIISGKWKGHQLVSFHGDHIRPTSDRVKESLFNILQFEIPESRVLDLFSGTGNLSFEALSRGAAHVTAVEANRKSIEIIKKNQAKLKVTDDFEIIQKDVLQFLKSYSGQAFDVVIADPPFTEKMAHDVMTAMATSQVFNAETRIVIESSSSERLDEVYLNLHQTSRREFGDKYLSFFSQV